MEENRLSQKNKKVISCFRRFVFAVTEGVKHRKLLERECTHIYLALIIFQALF